MEPTHINIDQSLDLYDTHSPDKYRLKSASVILTKLKPDTISTEWKTQDSSKQRRVCWDKKDPAQNSGKVTSPDSPLIFSTNENRSNGAEAINNANIFREVELDRSKKQAECDNACQSNCRTRQQKEVDIANTHSKPTNVLNKFIIQPDFEVNRKHVVVKTDGKSQTLASVRIREETPTNHSRINSEKQERNKRMFPLSEKKHDKEKYANITNQKHRTINESDVVINFVSGKQKEHTNREQEVNAGFAYLYDQTMYINDPRKTTQKTKRQDEPCPTKSSKRKCIHNNVKKCIITENPGRYKSGKEQMENNDICETIEALDEDKQTQFSAMYPNIDNQNKRDLTDLGKHKKERSKEMEVMQKFYKADVPLLDKHKSNEKNKSPTMEKNKADTKNNGELLSSAYNLNKCVSINACQTHVRAASSNSKQRTVPTILSKSRKTKSADETNGTHKSVSQKDRALPSVTDNVSHSSSLKPPDTILDHKQSEHVPPNSEKLGDKCDTNPERSSSGSKSRYENRQTYTNIKTQNITTLNNHCVYGKSYPVHSPTWSQFTSLYKNLKGYDQTQQHLYKTYTEMCQEYYKKLDLMYSPYNTASSDRYHGNLAYLSELQRKQMNANMSPIAAMQRQVNKLGGLYGASRWIPYHNQHTGHCYRMCRPGKMSTSYEQPTKTKYPSMSTGLSSYPSSILPPCFLKDPMGISLHKSDSSQESPNKILSSLSKRKKMKDNCCSLSDLSGEKNENKYFSQHNESFQGNKQNADEIESPLNTMNINCHSIPNLTIPVTCRSNTDLTSMSYITNESTYNNIKETKQLMDITKAKPSAQKKEKYKIGSSESFKEMEKSKDTANGSITETQDGMVNGSKISDQALPATSINSSSVVSDVDSEIQYLSDHAYTKTPDSSPCKQTAIRNEVTKDNLLVANEQKIPVYAVTCGNKLLLFSQNKADDIVHSQTKTFPTVSKSEQVKDALTQMKNESSFSAKRKRQRKQILKKPICRRLSRKRVDFAKHLNLNPTQLNSLKLTSKLDEPKRPDAGSMNPNGPKHMYAICICIDKNDTNSLTYTVNKLAITFTNPYAYCLHQSSYHVQLVYDVSFHSLKHLEVEYLNPGFYHIAETILLDSKDDKTVEAATLIPFPANIDHLPLASSWIAIGQLHDFFDPVVPNIPSGDLQTILQKVLPRDFLCYGEVNITNEGYRPKRDARIWYARQYFDFFTRKYCRLKRSQASNINKDKLSNI